MEKIGLALSGGGVRSFCQVGIIKVFEKKGIPVDIITGTSMGAIIGTIYSLTKDAEFLQEAVLKFAREENIRKIERIFSRHREPGFIKRIFDGMKDLSLLIYDSFKKGLISSESVLKGVKEYFKKDFYFEDAKIPLGITAAEYGTGKLVIFNRGKILPAIVASCAIPGLITPVEVNGEKYLDGGVVSAIPVFANAFLGGEKIIGIENESIPLRERPLNTFKIFVQVEKIKNRYSTELEGNFSDLLLKVELPGIEWFHFSQAERCIEEGEKVCLKNLDRIESFLERESAMNEFRKRMMRKMGDFFLTKPSM